MKQKLDLWLRRLLWVPMLVIFAASMQTVVWLAEREPPFHVLSARVIPPSVPGGSLRVEGEVYRDIERECTVTIIHWIEDADGFRYFLPKLGLTHDSIKRTHAVSPGQTKYVSTMPFNIRPGQAVYHAENAYICNPIHLVWPINVVTNIPFEVTHE